MADQHYLTTKEFKAIQKENLRNMKKFEKLKKRKVNEKDYLTTMRDSNNLVEFDNLHTFFFTDNGIVKAVNGITFDVPKHSIVGVVGESGCGKSITSLSLMQLVQAPQGQIVEGSIRFNSTVFKKDEHGNKIPVYTDESKTKQLFDQNGFPVYETEDKAYDIAKMPAREMYNIRGKDITMIFQEPMTSLNPVFTIGNQLDEVALLHIEGATKASAKARSIEMLNLVGISMPESVYTRFPHELSGGMRQRVMIAMALMANPKLIIADEPTTALDVTIQAQILDLLRDVQKKTNCGIMLITHDLGVIAEMVDYVVVMYAGRIIEKGTVKEIFDNPLHPYTIGLQKSKPLVTKEDDGPLFSIPGNVPNPINMPNHCYFKDRCDKCLNKCAGDYPSMVQVSPTHSVCCYLYEKKERVKNGR